ncbi:MAG TPA: DUF1080 domain-containing protein [Candidatus Limnocylindria bacterium]|jgi:hypothetical protein|nr:DUF1080 domain-containing protein [Candidatus Limnocylindria bacterium]
MKAFLLSGLLSAVALHAADIPTYLTPATGGPDYAAQGEYKNDWGGAQVIALGDDNFRMVTYPGGLPGAGWKKESKTETPGKREGGKIVFTGEDSYRAELSDGKITITTSSGGPYTMEKTERTSPTMGAKPPAGAVVLFDGTSADGWEGGHMDDRHLLAAGCKSKQAFGSFTAHVEFLLPFKPLGRGQDRANSGVYVQDRYEVQVLDSFGLKGENNECGGVYTLSKPAVNMCFPPLVWQTYDIDFTAAKYDAAGTKTAAARLTVKHNGEVVQDNLELKSNTPGNGRKEDASPGPFFLQGHGNPVYYRNIWVMPK